MVKRLIVIYGCHGSGKSTLAKNIIGERPRQIQLTFGKITVSKDGNVVALGSYESKTGGCDGLKRVDNYFNVLNEAVCMLKNAQLFIMEGAVFSTLINNPMKNFLRLKYEQNFDIKIILLDVCAETSFRRVFQRNLKIPNPSNIITKVKTVKRVFKKMSETGEFDCYSIKTDNLTAQEVFDNFRRISGNFRRC